MGSLAGPDVGGVPVEPGLLGQRRRGQPAVSGEALQGDESVGDLAGPAPLASGGGLDDGDEFAQDVGAAELVGRVRVVGCRR